MNSSASNPSWRMICAIPFSTATSVPGYCRSHRSVWSHISIRLGVEHDQFHPLVVDRAPDPARNHRMVRRRVRAHDEHGSPPPRSPHSCSTSRRYPTAPASPPPKARGTAGCNGRCCSYPSAAARISGSSSCPRSSPWRWTTRRSSRGAPRTCPPPDPRPRPTKPAEALPARRISGVCKRSGWLTKAVPKRPFTHSSPSDERLSGSSSTRTNWSSASTSNLIPQPHPAVRAHRRHLAVDDPLPLRTQCTRRASRHARAARRACRLAQGLVREGRDPGRAAGPHDPNRPDVL